nr:hypothetical protein CTI12_AA263670 [Tanacetum cinerariifolium]
FDINKKSPEEFSQVLVFSFSSGETVQNSLQQITHTLATLSTHENDERRNRGGPRLSRGRRNDQPQRQRIQPHGEDSDVEDEFEDGWIEGRRLGQRGVREFDYRQRAKDVPTFHASMNVEDFLDWMSELDTFFKFYKIPMGSRVDLVAYKLKGGATAQSWWKILQLICERQGKLPITSWERMERELRRFLPPNHDQTLFNLLQNCAQGNRSVEVYTAEFHRLSSRNNLSESEAQQVTRAENQLARSSILIKSVPSVDPSSQHTTKISSVDTGKQVVSTNTSSTKTTNPYARPVMGKCFKCGVRGHRSNDCRANGGKVNLTLRDDEFDNGGETNTSDEDVDAEICHPEGDSNRIFNPLLCHSTTKNIVARDIVQRLRLPMEKHPNPYKVGCIKLVSDIKVTERCKIPFMIGKYKDEIVFDIVDMDACHILLRRP